MTVFGDYLRERREALRVDDPTFSLRQLAGRIGVEPSYLSKVERGDEPPPSEARIVQLAEELGEDPDVLLAMAGFTQQRMTQKEGARRLGVSRSRTQQLVRQLWRAWDKAAPPAGVWQLQEWADRARDLGVDHPTRR